MKRVIAVVFFYSFFVSKTLFAQHINLPLSNSFFLLHEKELINNSTHTSFKPLIKSLLNPPKYIDIFSKKDTDYPKSLYKRKFLLEHLFIARSEDYKLIASPIINFGRGKEEDRYTFVNTRGFVIEGDIGDRLSFSSSFLENQASFPMYLDDHIRKNWQIVPGQGKGRDFKDGFDYAMSSGYVSLKLTKQIIAQFGHGKHFIGDGYRSLLLSDISFNYPFLRIQTNIGRVQYTNLYTEFQDVRDLISYETGYAKKYMSSHYLSINITSKINISLYEAIIWRTNHAPGSNGFDINYLNPIIFFRPVEYSLNSPDNVLAGVHAKYNISNNIYLYGQLILDEFSVNEIKKNDDWWGNKYGYQLGGKMFNSFKIPNLTIQAEYNLVRPYTYAHSNPSQNYAHYNQPLAHPLGANFGEQLMIINYRHKRFVTRVQIMKAKYGGKIISDPTSYGNDLYMSTNSRPNDFSISMYQGEKNELEYLQLNLGYIINPTTNLKIDVGIVKRNLKTEANIESTNYYYINLLTDLFNRYYDF